MSDYAVAVGRSGSGGFVLRIPALCLVVEDVSLDAAWTRLEADKAALIAAHRRIGAEGDLPSPVAAGKADRDLRRFALKAAIVALAASVVVAGAAMSFAYAVREPLRKVGMKLGRAAIAQVDAGLRQAAEADITPERLEEWRRQVAVAAPHLKPYVRELRPLLAEMCPSDPR